MSEFSIIENFFSVLGKQRNDVIKSVGDDAALVDTSNTQSLAISVDTLIEGVHFPESTNPYDIGWKSLAVNLSDMAAMAAEPRWITLALTLPKKDDNWLLEFSRGFSDLAELYNVQLIGGDTTRGTLSISVQIIGSIPETGALRRDQAQVGDSIYVTGFLGDAALGLKSLHETLPLSDTEKQKLLEKLNRPRPKVTESLKLASYINAAIDISDGLSADLSHILKASQVAGLVDVNSVPVSRSYRWCNQFPQSFDLALCGGDDYELCFTVAKDNEEKLMTEAEKLALRCTKIGEITEGAGLTFMNGKNEYSVQQKAFDHF